MAKISVIINNYNYGHYLGTAIDSVLAQDFADKELIVVDDGSTDDSREIIDRYETKVLRLFKKNEGQASCFASGFALSSGAIVLFLDSDDYLLPGCLEAIAREWRDGYSKIHFRMEKRDDGGAFLGYHPGKDALLDSGDVIPVYLKYGNYMTTVTSGNAFNRTFLRKVLPIPFAISSYDGDGYLNTLAPFHGEIGSIQQPFVVYRQHESSIRHSQHFDPQKVRRFARHELYRLSFLNRELAKRHQCAGRLFLYKNSDRIFHFLALRVNKIPLENFAIPPVVILVALALFSTWRYGRGTSIRARLGKSIWFLAFLIPGMGRKIASWKYAPATRPAMLRSVFHALKKNLFR